MLRVERLAARVMLDDPAPALARAEAEATAGDESWRRWVSEHARGEALIVRLETTLEASADDQGPLVIQIANRGVFLEKHPQPPHVEQQVGELVAKDFSGLVRELRARGQQLDEYALGQMYVHVELADDVREALHDAGAPHPRSLHRLPAFDAGVSEAEAPP